MNARFKPSVKWVLIAIIVVGAVTVVVTQRAVSRVAQQNQVLKNELAETQRLLAENREIPRLRAEVEGVEKLRRENQELPRLRNEVRQLHRETEELEKLRNENQQLLARQKSGSTSPVSAALLEGFISKAALADAGLGSPEATVQTFFCAICQGNFKRVGECSIHDRLAQLKGANEESMRADMSKKMQNFPGFAISEKTIIAEDEVEIGIKSSVAGEPVKFRLKRIGSEWKLND
jgi:predicted RNase H-like nuclease (RuvC/YqgF family)